MMKNKVLFSNKVLLRFRGIDVAILKYQPYKPLFSWRNIYKQTNTTIQHSQKKIKREFRENSI